MTYSLFSNKSLQPPQEAVDIEALAADTLTSLVLAPGWKFSTKKRFLPLQKHFKSYPKRQKGAVI
jgi:hypothetical protein